MSERVERREKERAHHGLCLIVVSRRSISNLQREGSVSSSIFSVWMVCGAGGEVIGRAGKWTGRVSW